MFAPGPSEPRRLARSDFSAVVPVDARIWAEAHPGLLRIAKRDGDRGLFEELKFPDGRAVGGFEEVQANAPGGDRFEGGSELRPGIPALATG